jgi:hypothetical protein
MLARDACIAGLLGSCSAVMRACAKQCSDWKRLLLFSYVAEARVTGCTPPPFPADNTCSCLLLTCTDFTLSWRVMLTTLRPRCSVRSVYSDRSRNPARATVCLTARAAAPAILAPTLGTAKAMLLVRAVLCTTSMLGISFIVMVRARQTQQCPRLSATADRTRAPRN